MRRPLFYVISCIALVSRVAPRQAGVTSAESENLTCFEESFD